MSILTLEHVNYVYKKSNRNTLQDINVSFENGKVSCIVGKSGCGKTTLLSLLAGLDVCSEGSILYDGKDLKTLDRDEYRAKQIGMVFQNYHLIPSATALENVILAMRISHIPGDHKELAYALLAKVGIDADCANRRVLKLSGGEQQRVGIARALTHDPKILLADEPSGNLDEESEDEIMDMLVTLAHEENRCVIIVTHSKNLCTYADEIWGMNNKGKLLYIE